MQVGQLLKLSGTIRQLKRERGQASFVLTQADRAGMGAIAIAAGLAGLGGQAISVASAAASAEEDADYLEFELDGKQVAGWVWRSPFSEGDVVDVAAYWDGKRYQLQAIARPSDGLTALYPHCSRGKRAHVGNAVKWWLIIGGTLMLGITIFIGWGLYQYPPQHTKLADALMTMFGIAAAFNFGFFGLMVFSLARKWMPFVRVAESAFRTLGWPNPESIDLVRSSKKLRTSDDSAEFGTFYFRYRPQQ
jgi:hypothetical protein